MATLIEQVKELRDRTMAGFADCKAALVATNGDMEEAIKWLRERGIAKAAKKAGTVAAEGLARVATNGNDAIIFELNAQTDFASQNANFIKIVDTLEAIALKEKATTLEQFLATKYLDGDVNKYIMEQAGTIGENIQLRRFSKITKAAGDIFGTYIHMGGKNATVIVLSGTTDTQVAKDIAMHSAAMKPNYVSMNDIPASAREAEKEVVLAQMAEDEKMQAMKKANPAQFDKILEGKLNKSIGEFVLEEQSFVKDLTKTVKAYVATQKAVIKTMIRYEVGEGIEVSASNFADEVAAQVAAAAKK